MSKHLSNMFSSYNSPRLGKHKRVKRIEIRWIGGGTDVLEDVATDRLIEITEGSPLPRVINTRRTNGPLR